MSSFEALRKKLASIVDELQPAKQTIKSLPSIENALKNPESINDRLLLLENLLTLMSELGDSKNGEYQKIGNDLQHLTIDFLYKDLPHPPSGYLALPPFSETPSAEAPTSYTQGSYVNYAYRTADGSYYNPLIPTMGQAGTPYARSVPGTIQTNLKDLPDPGLVFDTLLKRPTKAEGNGEEEDGFTPHPGGVSSLFFALADLIIHSIFNTKPQNPTVNNTSSYLDLSVLYGSSEKEVQSVRRKDDKGRPDGVGRLYEDVFADGRLLLMPPAACALLVVFSRNHNFIAQRIFDINERGTYKDPESLKAQIDRVSSPEASDEERKSATQALIFLQAQDDEIFHRSRLVNCGFFMKVILGDYVGAILGLARDGSSWRLDPLMEMRRLSHEFSPRGEGNVVSIEFNLLYRWHATLSRQDKQWTEKMFRDTLQKDGLDVQFSQLNPSQFFMAAGKALGQNKDVRTWTFDGLERDCNGRFSDAAIAKILQDSTAYRAGAFRARGIPEVLRVIEILGIEQARGWGACSLNEFRKFIGLQPYKSFTEWNSDHSVARAAEILYKDIDNLELHVGMQAEQAKVPGPGAGLCPGYTISRAILADAVCLTRGDRFLTVDYTPFNLTTWGFADCQYPTAPDGSFGGMLTKLLFRHFPAYYPARSAYAHFPFLDPIYMEKELQKRGTADQYVWTRPRPPVGVQAGEVSSINNYAEVKKMLNFTQEWKSDYYLKLGTVVAGLKNPKLPDMKLVNTLLDDSSDEWPSFFAQETQRLIKDRCVDHAGSQANLKFVDIVNDVINVLPVRWICQKLAGLEIGKEVLESEYINELNNVCRYVFMDWDPVYDWQLRESSTKLFREFNKGVKHHLETESGFVSNTLSHFAKSLATRPAFLVKLHKEGRKMRADELATALFCAVVPTAAQWAQNVAHIVNYYVEAGRVEERVELVTLIKKGKVAGRAMDLIKNALVNDPVVFATPRTALKGTSIVKLDGNSVVAGETVFANIIEANANRPNGEPGIHTAGEHGYLLSPGFFEKVTPVVVAEILALSNLQRGPGASGVFTRFTQHLHGVPEQVYVDARGGLTPFPTSLTLSHWHLHSFILHLTMQHLGKAALRVTKNYTKGYSDTQAKVRDATSNDPWGPSGTQMNEIAQLTYNQGDFVEIMEMLDKRLNDKGKNWRHVFKSLTVLDYCLHQGSENVVIYFRDNIYVIKTLKEFQYVDEDGKDQGANVRQKAKDITNLLQDESRLRQERRARASMRDRMIRGATGEGDNEDPDDENDRRRTDPRALRRNKDEDDLRRAIEESKKSLAQDRLTAEERDLQQAIKLSQEEEAKRNKAVEDSNASALFDDNNQLISANNTQQINNNPFPTTMTDPMAYTVGLQPQFTQIQPQFTSFNPYQQQMQQMQQEAAQAEYFRQQQELLQQQQAAQQAQLQQEEFMRQQMLFQQQQQQQQQQNLFAQQQPLMAQPTGFGSNNPFAPRPVSSPTSQSNTPNPPQFNLQGTYDNHNADNLHNLGHPSSALSQSPSPGPSQQRQFAVKTKSNENQELANLFADREGGQDTFGNVGQLRRVSFESLLQHYFIDPACIDMVILT
ncbi:heme peroxidase [Lentinula aciculospora]|uniref:Heme peroxidase n=1 Tax=Lentinula aciculospora TaxID=153920 RepID=A0A9W9A4L9_9AGAR|nr:heme peroxidase [Lentinula aciculospora]